MIYRGEAPTPELKAPAYYLANFFVGNCVKMKEIGPGSTPPWLPLPGSANELPKIGIMSNQIQASKNARKQKLLWRLNFVSVLWRWRNAQLWNLRISNWLQGIIILNSNIKI